MIWHHTQSLCGWLSSAVVMAGQAAACMHARMSRTKRAGHAINVGLNRRVWTQCWTECYQVCCTQRSGPRVAQHTKVVTVASWLRPSSHLRSTDRVPMRMPGFTGPRHAGWHGLPNPRMHKTQDGHAMHACNEQRRRARQRAATATRHFFAFLSVAPLLPRGFTGGGVRSSGLRTNTHPHAVQGQMHERHLAQRAQASLLGCSFGAGP